MEKPEEKEEKIEDIVQKIINGQITEIKEETKKEKISISLNKITSLNINEFQWFCIPLSEIRFPEI